ncbi:MAG TPA: 4-hydroxythreonine-4-phosphate dehydrogenase PdxA [Gemmataceae bacterium]|nr:4-hydroxythreonine-4-phosphate dehydrogenase PdxA [Gemmataceae bacterium]
MTTSLPRLLITMGDVAGIGPEIIARGWPGLLTVCQPIVVGDPGWLEWALWQVGSKSRVEEIGDPRAATPTTDRLPCVPGSKLDLRHVLTGKVCAEAGLAAYEFLCTAIERTLAGEAAGIVTAPLNKEGLRAAGLSYPGHTEILAEQTGTTHYGMMLFGHGMGVVHVTLHMALRDVFAHLQPEAVIEKIRLLAEILPRLQGRRPRIGVAALNPHASDGGLFGDEEERIIGPAVKAAQEEGIDVTGPWPADTLFLRARKGGFDGVVAMYHDQGHIALKLLGPWELVNITVGLPLVRTSVAHGTAYDIAGKGLADPSSLIEAARVAALLAANPVGVVTTSQ